MDTPQSLSFLKDSWLNHSSELFDDRVLLNIGGQKFEVNVATLQKYPETLLGEMFQPENKHLRKPDLRGEYFFDRSPKVFELIIDFYRTERLIVPENFPLPLLHEELRFFRLDFLIEEEREEKEDHQQDEEEDEEETEDGEEGQQNYNQELSLSSQKMLVRGFQLVQGSQSDVSKGLLLLKEMHSQGIHDSNLDCLFYLSLGYHRLGDLTNSRQYLKELLEKDPSHQGGLALRSLVRDKSTSNAKLGFFAVGFGALASVLIWQHSRKVLVNNLSSSFLSFLNRF